MKFSRLVYFAVSLLSQACFGFADLNGGIEASYLYFGVQEDSLGFAIEDVLFFVKNNPKQSQAKLKTHDPKWNSAFRLEANASSECAPVGCRFQWTRFQSQSEASAKGDPSIPTVAITTMIQNFSESPFLIAGGAQSCWKMNFNEFAFDLEAEKGCQCLSFSPHIGLLGVRIDQTQFVSYSGAVHKNIQLKTDISVCRKNHFWGVGPRVGFDVSWNFWNSLSLINKSNVALLAGQFDVKNTFCTPKEISPFSSLDQKMWRPRPMIADLMGLKWNKCLKGGQNVSVTVAYEVQYFWQQWYASSNFLGDIVTGEGHFGDLSFQGLVLSSQLSF